MTFRQWLGKKIAGDFYKKTNGNLTDMDRANALAIRRQETALRQAEKQVEFMERLMSLETTMNPKESIGDTAIKQLLPVLMSKMQGDQQQNQQQLTQPSTPMEITEYTEEQIKTFIKSNPKIKQNAHKFTNEQLKTFAIAQDNRISPNSIKLLIDEVRK